MSDVGPITISAENCVSMTGMSWDWITRFARVHDVPVWRVARKHLIPAPQLSAALQRAATAAAPVTTADEAARLEAEISAKLRKLGR